MRSVVVENPSLSSSKEGIGKRLRAFLRTQDNKVPRTHENPIGLQYDTFFLRDMRCESFSRPKDNKYSMPTHEKKPIEVQAT